jgi:vancomycin permeability regulator SanA
MRLAKVQRPTEWWQDALPRGFALFLGGFSLFNLLGEFYSCGFDANLWWIDLRLLPSMAAKAMLLVSGICFVGFAFRPPRSVWRKTLTLSCASALGIATLFNAIECYALLARGAITITIPLPLSLLITVALATILAGTLHIRTQPASLSNGIIPALTVALVCVITFPLAQMLCFGKTDYRRSADVAVVFGARVYADGRPSDALADRVRTACQLYQDGLVKKLIFSGGPGDGPVGETESMKRMAVRLGVRAQDIMEDAAGLNTQATVRNTGAIFKELHASRVLAVSHFYHLPRIKMTYHREGWEVYTVPAKETYLLRQLPYNMAREVAALWTYYLRPLGVKL